MDMIWEGLSCYLSCSKWYYNSGDLSFEKYKNVVWWVPCMTKLEFLLEPYIIFRLGKLSFVYAACCALSLIKLCWCLMRGLSCS
jgi:hypothetical protein